MSRSGVRRTALLALAALASLSATAPAQVTVVDEGSFSLLRDGTRLGREDFSIRLSRNTPGNTWVAQGNVLVGEERRASALTTDSAGAPQRFQLETRDGTRVTGTVTGERQRGVWSGRVLRPGRESARELRLPRDAFIVEAGITHHLWFLVRFGEGRPVSVLGPSGPSQQLVVVEEQAPDRVALGLRELVARRFLVRSAEGGAALWEIWTDPTGRLLRAVHLESALEALRDEPPPETRGAGRA